MIKTKGNVLFHEKIEPLISYAMKGLVGASFSIFFELGCIPFPFRIEIKNRVQE
jgi:hypothetical protein